MRQRRLFSTPRADWAVVSLQIPSFSLLFTPQDLEQGLKSNEGLDDPALSAKLWEVIDALAGRNTVLSRDSGG
jgi:hypothetical protein